MTRYPIEELGGMGDVIHIAPANGFPIESYQPLIDELSSHYKMVHLPPRGVWQDEPLPSKHKSWKETVAYDLEQGIDQHNLRNLIGMGHSFGGIATLLTAIAIPHRFKALILLDPTILSRSALWGVWLYQQLGLATPLSKGAERRRDHFDSYDDADNRLRKKALFVDWDEHAFQGYIDSMRADPNGGVCLKWAKKWEAYYFRTLYTHIWRELPKLKGHFPILLIRGGTSDTLSSRVVEQIRHILPDMVYHEIVGHGHLFPQSAPHQTTQIIHQFLSEI
jgi:pimeloyl-ACP methyl ester carboxylesterase